jgi:hypothetical protein
MQHFVETLAWSVCAQEIPDRCRFVLLCIVFRHKKEALKAPLHGSDFVEFAQEVKLTSPETRVIIPTCFEPIAIGEQKRQ